MIAIRSRWVAAIVAGLVGGFTFAQSGPVEFRPMPKPAEPAVTVHYEKLPSGEIRPVSSAPVPAPQAPAPPVVELRPLPVTPATEIVYPAPSAQYRPVPIQFTTSPLPGPRYEPSALPVQPSFAPTPINTPAPVAVMPVQPQAPVSYGYQRLPNGAIMPTTTPEAPSITTAVPPARPTLPRTVIRKERLAPHTVRSPQAETPSPMPMIVQEPMGAINQPVTTETDEEKLADYGISLTPPPMNELYRLESEAALKRRIADETKKRKARPTQVVEFPTYKALSDSPYAPREFGGLIKQIEPNYVCYRRLYAEDVNTERYGWEFGVLQPLLSTGTAFRDFAMVPYNWATRPCQRYECSAGHCYPGDPVPYLIYPLEVSATGTAWEAGVIAALFAVIP